jgi:hypothetical protein
MRIRTAIGAVGAALIAAAYIPTASAGSNVGWNVSIGVPGFAVGAGNVGWGGGWAGGWGVAAPPPVWVAPPVWIAPPVVVPAPPVVVVPRPVWVAPRPVWVAPRAVVVAPRMGGWHGRGWSNTRWRGW